MRSPRPDPAQQLWAKVLLAYAVGLLAPAALGYFGMFLSDAPLSGLAKDGSGRSLAAHLTILSTALFLAPIFGVLAMPLAVPTLWACVSRQVAGWAVPPLSALVIGLPLVHVVFNGDLTTEQPDLLGHIGVALALIGSLCWLWLWRGPDPFCLRLPRKA